MGFQRINKKGMEFKSTLQSIVIVSLLVIAYGVIIVNQSEAYGTGIASEIDQYNKLDDISETSGGFKEGIGASDPNPGQDAEANTFRAVYGLLTNIFSSFDLIIGEDGMVDGLTDQLGIPSYIRQGFIAIFAIAVVFTLVGIIFRLSRGAA